MSTAFLAHGDISKPTTNITFAFDIITRETLLYAGDKDLLES